MTAAPRFHPLRVARVSPESDGAVAVALAVPPALRDSFRFEPGQFLTLRTKLAGQDVRRSYSICCPRARLDQAGELEVGIRAVDGGLFSSWATTALKAGDTLEVMPPDGRFTVRRPRALHRVGFAAGSGITPILSIVATTLAEQPASKFTLVYGNRRMASVMFNEALQDLKDRYPDRLTLIHILSRQAQEVDLLEGRIDALPTLRLGSRRLHHSGKIGHRFHPGRAFRLRRVIAGTRIKKITAAAQHGQHARLAHVPDDY